MPHFWPAGDGRGEKQPTRLRGAAHEAVTQAKRNPCNREFSPASWRAVLHCRGRGGDGRLVKGCNRAGFKVNRQS